MSSAATRCSRRWCVRETGVRADDGSLATFHHGAVVTVKAGDDSVIAALVASDDDPDVIYVEVHNVSVSDTSDSTVWLTADEARDVAAMLVIAAADARR